MVILCMNVTHVLKRYKPALRNNIVTVKIIGYIVFFVSLCLKMQMSEMTGRE